MIVTDLLIAWLREFFDVIGSLAVDALVIIAGLLVTVLVAARRAALRILGRLGRSRKRPGSDQRDWARFVAGHPLDDFITVTEDTPDA